MNFQLSNTPASPRDDRDYQYQPSTIALTALPKRVDLRSMIPDMEDQAEQGACVFHSIPSILEYMTFGAGRWEDLSRQFGYNANRIQQGRMGEEGTYPRDALETVRKIGICLEDEFPYGPENANKVPPATAYESASKRRIGRYESVPFNPENWQDAIQVLKAAIFEASLRKCSPPTFTMKLGRRYFDLKGPLSGHNYISFSSGLPGAEYVGNHEQYFAGYDDNLNWGSFIIAGSWANWGDNGFAAIPYVIVRDFIEAWVVRSFHGVDLVDPVLNGNQRKVTQLYVALFGRAPERDGMRYWVSQLESGWSVAGLAQAMYDVWPARVFYPLSLTNAEIIRQFYVNVLGRKPDTDGLDFWTRQLDIGRRPGSVIADMIAAVVDYAGADPAALKSQALFNNRTAVGMYCAVDLACNSVPIATIALNGVTDDPETVEAARKVIRSRIGLGLL